MYGVYALRVRVGLLEKEVIMYAYFIDIQIGRDNIKIFVQGYRIATYLLKWTELEMPVCSTIFF